MSMVEGSRVLSRLTMPPHSPFELMSFMLGNIFQNRRVSSPAPVTTLCPSGLMLRYNTLYVWPVSVAIFCMLGYCQTMI